MADSSGSWGLSIDGWRSLCINGTGSAFVAYSGMGIVKWTDPGSITPVPTPAVGVACTLERISESGQVTVGVYRAIDELDPYKIRSFRTVGTTSVDLGTIGTRPWVEVFAASSDCATVVGECRDAFKSNRRAFQWRNGQMTDLGGLPGRPESCANIVSEDGSTVFGYSVLAGDGYFSQNAWRWVAGVMTPVGPLPGDFGSLVMGTNRTGTAAVGVSWNTLGVARVFRWTASGLEILGDVPADAGDGSVPGVSDDGSVVVGNFSSGVVNTVVRWSTGSGAQQLGEWTARAVSRDGAVVLGDHGGEALVWTAAAGLRSLGDVFASQSIDMSDLQLTEAPALSADGKTLCGNFRRPSSGRGGVYLARGIDLSVNKPVPRLAVWGSFWPTPVDLGTPLDVQAGGHHAIALRRDGAAVAWGSNFWGEISLPPDLGTVREIAAGGSHSMARRADGTVVCWGAGTFVGGGGDTTNYGQSVVPASLGFVTRIAAGGTHSMAIQSDGSVIAWGDNSSGQSAVPGGLRGVVGISAGQEHSAALTESGQVRCWGAGATNTGAWPHYGQSIVPAALAGVRRVAVGGYHTLALRHDGSVTAWGAGALDTGDWPHFGQSSVPAGLGSVERIDAGLEHNLALRRDGTVVAWGRNFSGQSTVPTGLAGVTGIAAGQSFSMAIVGSVESPSCRSDLDGSGTVDFGDLAISMLGFGPCYLCDSDLDGNNLIDFGDLAVILLDFGACP